MRRRALLAGLLFVVTTTLALPPRAGADDKGADFPHYYDYSCPSCHYMVYDTPPAWLTPGPGPDDTAYNKLCASCHDDVIANAVKTHSSTNTTDRYGSWSIECRTCHWPHHQKQLRVYGSDAYLATGGSTGLTATTLTMAGAGWTADQFVGYLLVPNTAQLSYNYKITGNTGDTVTVARNMDLAKASLGDTFAIVYGKLVKAEITTPNSGDKTVRFFDTTGANSFADGDATYDGVCEVCHTQTTHFRNDGSGSDQTHANLGGKAGTNCTTCHSHENGFGHGGSSGDGCVECHGHDSGTLYDPDMSVPYTAGASASQGRGSYQSHSTHTETDSDDARGPGIYCDTCHDISNMPTFKSGTDSNGDGRYSLAETDVCDTCHSPGGTYDGVDDPVVGAKNNWDSGVYSGAALQSGKEKWCATCHDESPSVISGVTAPNVIGDEDGAYTYGTGWGFYKTGHGLDNNSTYPASGGYVYGAGKECDDCHDLTSVHIDGDARTYSAAADNYQAGYRLDSINGMKPSNIPRPQNLDDHDPDHYRLCFSCHDPNIYLRTAPDPVTTGFRDDLDLGPWDGGDPPINIHEYHLTFNSLDFDSDWDGTNDSDIACVNCHNVHGSTQLSMVRDGKLVGREPGLWLYYDNVLIPPTTGSATPPSPDDVTLDASTGTIFQSGSPGNICGHCHGGGWVKYYRTAPAAPAAPTLSWTGEAGYLTDGVAPDSGTSNDYFTFRISYTDANAQIPRTIQVWIDADDDGSYAASEKHDMYAVDTGDLDVTDGKLYRTIVAIPAGGDNTLAYRFYASDGHFDAVNGAGSGDPTDPVANTISLANNPPALSWTGEAGYSGDGVNPDAGGDADTFTFRVDYTDADDDAPTSIQVWIDKNDNGDYLDVGEKVDMTAVDAGDTTYSDGKRYTAAVSLATAGDTTLAYRFAASDGSDSAVGSATADHYLTVNGANTAPTLAWTGETGYTGDGVDPDSDVGASTFTFRVDYTDADNDTPAFIQVWIDKNDDGDYLDSGEKVDMTAADADADLSDGKRYTADVSLAVAGDGILDYRFYASDGTADATGLPTADHFLTILTGALKVSCPGVGDYDYTSIQAAIDNATSGDTIVVADGTCSETIVVDNKDLTIKSVNGAGSTTIDGSGSGPVVTLQNGADTTLRGFTVTGGSGAAYGAGIYSSGSSPTIDGCTVTGNSGSRAAGIYVTGSGSTVTISDTTISNNTSSEEGPGLYLTAGVSAVITDSSFTSNSTTNGYGGGIYMSTNTNATLTISGSSFTGNTVTNAGGGIYIAASGGTVNIDIDDSAFSTNNGGQRGGGLYFTDSGATTTLTLDSCTIDGNSSTLDGSAIYASYADTLTLASSTVSNHTGGAAAMVLGNIGSLTISDSTIRDNTSTGSFGGGMMLSGASATVERTTISGNTCGQRGGGAYVYTLAPVFRNCVISGNKTNLYEGGGMVFDGSSVNATVMNTTFTGNYSASTQGGAINVRNGATVTVQNSILYGNGGPNGNAEIYGSATVSYSNIHQRAFEGNNNIDIDPQFVTPVSYAAAPTSAGDLHLAVTSPLVDAASVTGAPADDIDADVRPSGSGIDIGADEVVTVVNNGPTLAWTGESGYTADGVAPDRDQPGATFTFRVDYTDIDNDAPATIQLWIDKNDDGDYLDSGEKVDLTAVDGGDSDYTDGKRYSTALALAAAGDNRLSYRFVANDGTSGAATAAKTVTLNSVPTLAWLGSGNYASDGVDPDAGAGGTSFDFRVRYTDADNDPPSAIQLWLDTNDDGDYDDAGEHLTMTALDSGDTTYSDGKDYTAVTTLAYAGDGTLAYRFFAADGDTATGAPTSGATLTVTNTAPTLAWVGSGAYVSDGVNPNGGTSGANSFEFRVSYTDADDQPPATMEVWIDENDNGTYEAGEKHAMGELDGGDTTYTDGKLYTYTATNLVRQADDFLGYRFAASDGIDAATGDPVATGGQVGVYTANQPPDLDWTGETHYTADGVDPDTGMAGDTFTFRIKYTDVENSAPASIQVWVDLDDDSVQDGGELTDLNAVDPGDTVYDDGKLYTGAVTIAAVTNPSTTYTFLASDGTDAATGNGTANMTVTVNTPITVCSSGCDFTQIQAAIADAGTTDGAYVQVKDGTYSENIDFLGKNITVISQNGAATTTILGDGSNNPVVTFATGETGSAVLDGFTIDNQNNSGSAARGVYVNTATPTIKNSIITGNAASNGTDGGGGVYVVNGSPTIDNCTISANVAANRSGCGMYIKGASGGATITNGTVIENNNCANGYGGAIYYTGATSGSLSISGSTIQNNQSANNGAGLYLTTISNATTISNSTITGNASSNGHGGGIYATTAPLVISGSTISNNSAGNSKHGGGIYIYSTTATISDTSISSNTDGGYGGGIHMEGTTPVLSLNRCQVRGNKANAHGGGIRIASGTATITNTIVTGNRVVNNYQYGGGIANSGTLNLYFSTVADNYAHDGGGIYASGTENITNSIVWGNVGPLGNPEIRGTTDTLYLTETNGDTSFVSRSTASQTTSTTDGDYHLQASSNCIDTGDATNGPADDLDGTARPVDITGKGDGVDDYDKGAYEYSP